MIPETVGDSVMEQLKKSRNIRAQIDELTELRRECFLRAYRSGLQKEKQDETLLYKLGAMITDHINLLIHLEGREK